MKKIVSVLLVSLLTLSAYAIVATPEPIEKTQADGSKITVRLVGDEFHSYYTKMDGTPIRLNDKGMWVEDPSVAEMPERAKRARRVVNEVKVNNGFPLTGAPKSIVILVNFADVKFQYKLDDFQRMLNVSGYSENGGIGSARDYFIANSDSAFAPQFDCYGPVTLSKNMAYYGGNSGSDKNVHADRMVVEACNLAADELGVDFTQYDTNGDDRIDNVFIFYAGHNESEGASSNTIWPHRFIVQTGERVQGKLIYDYACTGELRGAAGNGMCGIGTFCHEFGHVLGLPDYYDTGYTHYTVGTWDIMCSGGHSGNGKTPPSYTAAERFQLGWLTPKQLTDAGVYTLEPLENGKQQAYLIAATNHNLSWESASPSEYWILENRQHVGWDKPETCLPGTGMLIWHIDYNASAWGSNTPNNYLPLRYHIEEAGGQRGYAATSDPFPGTKNVTTFTPMLHDGELLEQPLTDIAQVGENITFMFKSNDFMFVPAEMPVIKSTYNTETRQAVTPASIVKVVGSNLDPNVAVTISVTGDGYAISRDSSKWNTSLSATVMADSTMEEPIYVRYSPRKQVCDIQRGTLTVRQGSAVGTLPLRGTSPRPVLIEAPDVTKLEEVTPTSFKAHWTPQTDAEYYYVTLYHMEEGRESTMESFEGFDDEAVVQESGWYTSFYRTTTKAKEEGEVSLWFKENNEIVLSPIYPLPVVELSMWLNAPATSDSEVGFFILTAYGETGVDTLDRITITKNTKKYTYSRTLEEDKGYRRFQLEYTSNGGEGACLDAFTTTFNQKTIYTYKGREKTIQAQEGEEAADYTVFYAYDLNPNTTYYLQLQCSENKGCEEHLSPLSQAVYVFTPDGEAANSKRLTLAYDSINYDPATHVIYLPQSLTSGQVNIYSVSGELVKSIPVSATHNVVRLKADDLRVGSVYVVKYIPEGRMRRKGPSLKILFK